MRYNARKRDIQFASVMVTDHMFLLGGECVRIADSRINQSLLCPTLNLGIQFDRLCFCIRRRYALSLLDKSTPSIAKRNGLQSNPQSPKSNTPQTPSPGSRRRDWQNAFGSKIGAGFEWVICDECEHLSKAKTGA